MLENRFTVALVAGLLDKEIGENVVKPGEHIPSEDSNYVSSQLIEYMDEMSPKEMREEIIGLYSKLVSFLKETDQ
jgi:hypothetical protein